MKRINIIISVLVLFAFLAAGTAVVNAEGKTYRFFLPVSKGMAGGGFSKLMDKLTTKVGEATGLNVLYTEQSYDIGLNVNDLIYKQLKPGNTELTYVNALGYIEEKEKWDEIFVPAFTIIMNNAHYNEFCMYAPKGGDIKTVGDAVGKIWGGMNTVPTRLLMHEAGIDEPLGEFFSETKFLNESPVTNFIEAQAAGDIDVFTAIKAQVQMSGGASVPGAGEKSGKPAISFEEIACTEGDHAWIFGFHKSVSEDAMLKIAKTMVKAYKDPNFSEFQFMFKAIKGRFMKFDPEKLKRTEEIAALKKKLGWDKEMLEHFKKAKN